MSRGNFCQTCVDAIGWDPEEDCPGCPVHAAPPYPERKHLTEAPEADRWTCTCEGDVAWSEGIPHWTRLTDPDCPTHQEDA